MRPWRALATAHAGPAVCGNGTDFMGVFEVDWSAVKLDVEHLVSTVPYWLGVDLAASKDGKGRDPETSYAGVVTTAVLARLREMGADTEGFGSCPPGHTTVRVFALATMGVPWAHFFGRVSDDVMWLVAGSLGNWDDLMRYSWPVFEVLGLVQQLYDESLELECRATCNPEEQSWWGSDSSQRLSASCPCLRAAGLADQAVSVLAAEGLRGRQNALSLVRSVQSLMAEWVGSSRSRGTLALAGDWPVFEALGRLSKELRRLRESSVASPRRPAVVVLYCGPMDLSARLQRWAHGRGVVVRAVQGGLNSAACTEHYVRNSLDVADAVMFISPWTHRWTQLETEETEKVFTNLLSAFQRYPEVELGGAPCVDRAGYWVWPPREVKRKYWKLAYRAFPTGFRAPGAMKTASDWVVGDVTSGTRIYDATLLRKLLNGSVAVRTGLDVAEFLVELDIRGVNARVAAATLVDGTVLREDNYLEHAMWPASLAREYAVEAAEFTPTAGRHIVCLFPNAREANYFAEMRGTVISWCIRERLNRMFQNIAKWWHALGDDYFIVPVSASVLNMVRNGEAEVFPWEADIDINLLTTKPVDDFRALLAEHVDALAQLGSGYKATIRGDRAVFSDTEDTVRMDVWISGGHDLASWDIRTQLAGVEVRLYQDFVFRSFHHYKPGVKVYGHTAGKLLGCLDDHPACMVDCYRRQPSTHCEFDDFVHLNSFL
mmetsp:Transcript_40017/g.104954  ORF Transcript_40017/g.104954 Transcript_40017/m.104954 type:complete len:716 (-) Transcript_40017:156-2303(-)